MAKELNTQGIAVQADDAEKVFSLDDPPDIAAALHGMGLVLNCAGTFFEDRESGDAGMPDRQDPLSRYYR